MADERGVRDEPPARLAPPELAARLDRILACAEGLISSVPAPYVEHRSPGRDLTLRELAYHVFRMSLAFADGMDLGRVPEAWVRDRPPRDLDDGGAIARYGALVRGRLGGWFEGSAPREYARVIDAFDGPVSGHDLLDRTTRQAAQHLRQLYAMVEEIGITPPMPISAADLDRLLLPASPS